MVEIPDGHFYLGEQVDAATHERTGEPVLLEASDLTTHGVIVGMTGSGKTGLGIITLEEALLSGIPTLVLDPKGDMGNLCLAFPELAPADFEPWINPADAEREGRSPAEHAAATAELWRSGLESWGIGSDRIARLVESSRFTIYTPGSTSGVPVDLIGDLSAPVGADAETIADEVEGFVTSLLGLVGIDADPLSSREHILLSNLVHHAWDAGRDLDLASLLAQIQDPPMRKLGVLELDAFYPAADRTQLALKLNGLLASPSFAAWTQGEPLDLDAWLDPTDGPRASIVSLAHLSDEERQFVVTLVLSRLVTWMRSQPGTPELRALVYMDEVFGYVPPTAQPPTKKPILTILKQARAFGVGLVLSTQNPVDVDYKALSNAGTWMIGRLQTERDKARLLEGMESAAGGVDLGLLDATISGLGKREFLLHQTRSNAPVTFGTRWAMSYLAGPLTRGQIEALTPDRSPITPASAAGEPGPAPTEPAASTPLAPELADDESSVAPEVAEGVPVRHLDPAAPWADQVGAVAGGRRLVAGLAARVHLVFDERAADLRHEQEWEAVIPRLDGPVDPTAAIAVDYDDRDLRPDPPNGAAYVLTDARIDTKTFFNEAARALRDELYRTSTVELFHNPELKLYSRVGETREEFARRCSTVADEGADAEAAELRDTLERRSDRIRDAIAKAEDRVREIESDVSSRRGNELLSAAGDVLGGLLGGRRSTRSILGGLRRAGSKREQSTKAGERLESAKNRLAEKVDELEDLETELTESLFEIQDAWDAKAEAIETVEVGLEKNDIDVAEVALVWIPTEA